MNLPEFILKYLSKQDLNSWEILPKLKRYYNNIFVVPALNENDNIIHLINSLSRNDEKELNDSLLLFVVNNADGASENIYFKNSETINFLNKKVSNNTNKLNLAYIDASSPGLELPTKHAGAGMARKIGMDLALYHFNYSNESPNLLICLDADCTVNKTYLNSIITVFREQSIHAATVEFEHPLVENENINRAIINYEIFLRYYVLGLIYANSNYSHLSVGSAIVCDVETYVKAGGMNKRKGGEDFYFLNEIAKFTKIIRIPNARVYPSSRISERVPFGTGPRIKRFISNTQNEYLLYSPETFEILKSWLKVYSDISSDNNSIIEVVHKANKIDTDLYKFLISQNFENDWKNILRNSRLQMQIDKQKLLWMDGFKTLKLIHFLRDRKFKNVSMFDAIDILLGKMNKTAQFQRKNEIPELEIQIQYLKILREITNLNL